MNRTLALAALLLSSCSTAPEPPKLSLSDAWARETVAGQNASAAYFTISNRGGDDRLVEVTAAAPVRASLHTTSYENGVARMRPLSEGLQIAKGETVVLRPGGTHIMVEQLAGPLAIGDRLQLTLRFERSGVRALEVPVHDASAPEMMHQGH